MDGITKQTRRQSYDGIRTRSGERCKLILETLGNRSMTVEEITDELVVCKTLISSSPSSSDRARMPFDRMFLNADCAVRLTVPLRVTNTR